MSVRIESTYEGHLHCQAAHGPSRTTLTTDAPVDNLGRGESFSPTDLMATALGTCMLTTMGIYAQKHELDLTGAVAVVDKEMTSEPPRRIARLVCSVRLPLGPHHPHRAELERVAAGCPVMRSLHPDVEKPLSFQWLGGDT